MSKFGLLEADEDRQPQQTFSERLAEFPTVRDRHTIDLVAADAAAAPHGFISREPIAVTPEPPPRGRRRRAIPSEPTRHLAIRLVSSQYDEFVAYADRHKLTYHEALARLLDQVQE